MYNEYKIESPEAKEVLRMKDKLIHMRDKLNDISRRNRSIRLLKLYNKWSFDLAELDSLSRLSKEKVSASIVEQIIHQSKNEVILLKPTIDNVTSMNMSRKLTDLYRNIKGIEDETGIFKRSQIGYYNYYCITDNTQNVYNFKDKIEKLLFKWLNRRSQRKSFTWDKFSLFLKKYPLPSPRIKVNIYDLRKEISYIL